MLTYQVAASAFTVGDIADSISSYILSDEKAVNVWEMYRGIGIVPDAFYLVQDCEHVIGYVTLEDFIDITDKEIRDIAKTISTDQMVPISTPILDMLPLFEKHHFYFVLDRNEITHVVSFSDLDKIPMKLCLFSLFMELESEMLNRLISSMEEEHYLKYLSTARLDKAIELCKTKYKEETPGKILLCTNFVDKMNMFLSDVELSTILQIESKRKIKNFFSTIQNLRNQIAHSDSIFKIISEPFEFNAFVKQLTSIISSISSFNKGVRGY